MTKFAQTCAMGGVMLSFLAGLGRAQVEEGVVPKPAKVSTIQSKELAEFAALPEAKQALIQAALALTRKELTYTFQSADPKNGGMDCSGAIHYLLKSQGFKEVPRQSDLIAQWVIDGGQWTRTDQATSLRDSVFKNLQPGDLLFWAGTYQHTDRKLPVSHVMLYLGKNSKTGKRVIFGASDGRSYEGQSRRGVSVFDFAFPKSGGKVSFYGYGRLPTPKGATKK